MKKNIFLFILLFLGYSAYGQVTETKYWTLKKTVTKVEAPSIPTQLFNDVFPINYLTSTFRSVGHVFHYTSDNIQYMFFPGFTFYPHYNNSNKPGSIDVVEPSPALIFKRTNGVWAFWKEIPELKTWMIRNFKIKDNWVIIGDGNEIGKNTPENRWRGNAFLGKIGSEGKIDWVKVNDENNMAYFHGITMGDLNGDGLMDVGGSPAFYPNPYGIKTFIQNKNGSFTNQDSIVIYNKDYFPPFTIEYEDLNGDGIDEIITADYGHPDDKMNHVMVYTLNKHTNKFENTFVSKEPTAFYNVRMGATSIKVHDFTGDGIKDLSIAREGRNELGANHSFEIWKGNGDGTFTPHWSTPIWNENELQFREFSVFDVNNDGYLDIILRPFHYGSFYRNNPVWWNVPLNNGIKLNKVIWLNDGKGKFNHYDKDELKIEAINIDNVHPYIDSGNLHFMGTYIDYNKLVWNREVKSVDLETYDIQVHLNGIDAPKKPDLTFPQKDYSGLTGGTEFKWSSTENARKYQIQFSTVATFTTLYLESDTLTQSSFKMPAFKPGDPIGYYWRVRGIGVGGNGEWSSIHNFTRAALTSDENVALPNKFELYQNYPNPFNPSTQIQFSLPSSSPVKIEVYNSVGQQVKVLVDELMSSGTHSITFDASFLSSGVYLYRLTTPEFVETKKMNYIK